MSELIVINGSCSQCGANFLEMDNFCRNCGLPTVVLASPCIESQLTNSQHQLALDPSRQSAVAQQRENSLISGVLENRFYVIAILLCAGPIGLPALWFSRRFSQRAKIITTIGYFIVTAILPLAVAWYFLEIAVRPIADVLS